MKVLNRGADRPRAHTPDDAMTLMEHLRELRMRIVRVALAVGIGVILVLAFYDRVLHFLLRPYANLCARRPTIGGAGDCQAQLVELGPLDGFSTRFRVALYGGLVLALPVIMWQLWRFIVPALHAKEKKYAIPFIFSVLILFALGGVLAYITFDKALEFLISWAGDGVKQEYQITKYISLITLTVVAFGVGFEFPVLLVFLMLVNAVTPNTLLRQWRYAIMIIFVAAAVITPSGDPISMLALAIPMVIFYFIALAIGFLVQRSRRKRVATTA